MKPDPENTLDGQADAPVSLDESERERLTRVEYILATSLGIDLSEKSDAAVAETAAADARPQFLTYAERLTRVELILRSLGHSL